MHELVRLAEELRCQPVDVEEQAMLLVQKVVHRHLSNRLHSIDCPVQHAFELVLEEQLVDVFLDHLAVVVVDHPDDSAVEHFGSMEGHWQPVVVVADQPADVVSQHHGDLVDLVVGFDHLLVEDGVREIGHLDPAHLSS